MEEDAADGLRSVTDSILTDTEPDGAENDPYGRIGYPRPRHRTPVHARDPAIGSVLTRSEERVQRRRAVALLARRKGFQSSPAPKSGCNDGIAVLVSPRGKSFNPHPLRRAGATSASRNKRTPVAKFQSSPAPKSGCNVSVGEGEAAEFVWFQSSPAPKSGCNLWAARYNKYNRRFNPHPLRRAGATR